MTENVKNGASATDWRALLEQVIQYGSFPQGSGIIHDLRAEVAALKEERDELLAALHAMLTHMGMDEDEWNKPTFDQARAAIAKAEGGAA